MSNKVKDHKKQTVESENRFSQKEKQLIAKKDQKHSEMEQRIQEHNDQLAQKDQEHEVTKSSLEEHQKTIFQKDQDAVDL